MVNSTQARGADAQPLADALNKSKQTAETVKEAADDLAVIHTVLDTGLPEKALSGDVGNAVKQVKAVEKKLNDSADLLDEVNEAIEKNVQGRHDAIDGSPS